MNGELNRLDDLFREGMEEHQEMPSPKVWETIEEQLDKKDRRRPFTIFFSSYKKVAAVLLIGIISASLFAGGYFLINKYSSDRSADTAKTENVNTGNALEEKKITDTQPKENSIHHTPVDSDTKIFDVDTGSEKQIQLTDDSKDQLITKSPSNEAVANQPYVQKSVTLKNKTVVAGSRAINKYAGNVDNNASSAVKATEEQTNLASIAIVQWRQHEFAPIEESVVPINPITTKTPTTLSAPAATVNPTQIPVLDKKKNKKVNFSITPLAIHQSGKVKLIEKIPVIMGPPPTPGNNNFIENVRFESYNYKPTFGLLTSLDVGKSFSFQTGFNISRQYFWVEKADVIAEQRPDGRIKYSLNNKLGTIYIDPKYGARPNAGDIINITNIKTSYNYLQIPLLVNYYIGKRNLQGFITVGGNLSILKDLNVSGNILQLREKHKIKDKQTHLKSSFTNLNVGGGLKWNFNNRFAFILNSQYQLALTPYSTPTFTKAYQRNLSIQTGIQINLRK